MKGGNRRWRRKIDPRSGHFCQILGLPFPLAKKGGSSFATLSRKSSRSKAVAGTQESRAAESRQAKTPVGEKTDCLKLFSHRGHNAAKPQPKWLKLKKFSNHVPRRPDKI